eukprot:6201094-Pleurochrysis_carterae.AAC.4
MRELDPEIAPPAVSAASACNMPLSLVVSFALNASRIWHGSVSSPDTSAASSDISAASPCGGAAPALGASESDAHSASSPASRPPPSRSWPLPLTSPLTVQLLARASMHSWRILRCSDRSRSAHAESWAPLPSPSPLRASRGAPIKVRAHALG